MLDVSSFQLKQLEVHGPMFNSGRSMANMMMTMSRYQGSLLILNRWVLVWKEAA